MHLRSFCDIWLCKGKSLFFQAFFHYKTFSSFCKFVGRNFDLDGEYYNHREKRVTSNRRLTGKIRFYRKERGSIGTRRIFYPPEGGRIIHLFDEGEPL